MASIRPAGNHPQGRPGPDFPRQYAAPASPAALRTPGSSLR